MHRVRFSLQPALDVAIERERDAALAFARARAMLERARIACEAARIDERVLRLAAPNGVRGASKRFAAADRACTIARDELERAMNARRAFEVLRAAFVAARRRRAAMQEASEDADRNATRRARGTA
jgi:hypothetical protein